MAAPLTESSGRRKLRDMRQGLRIATNRQRDAECIGDALREYGSEVEPDSERWVVQIPAPSAPELTAVLAALKACLDEEGIGSVNLTIDGQDYLMEGMA
jgi:hypothetical protein